MGIRSYVRDRKQVKASRAGEGLAKLSAGDFSHFGGQNGARGGEWGGEIQPANGFNAQTWESTYPASKREAGVPDYTPKTNSGWDSDSDVYGRTGAMKDKPSYGPYDRAETADEETARGARMKVSDNVTLLGSNSNGAYNTRTPVDANTRARGEVIKRQNKDQNNQNDLPSSADALKEGRKSKNSYAWDEE